MDTLARPQTCDQRDGITQGTVHYYYNCSRICVCEKGPVLKPIQVYEKGGLTYLRELEQEPRCAA